jgi:NAD(P)-dependent dehydrogenase (short-subunit alcohol dehydrogenase family)
MNASILADPDTEAKVLAYTPAGRVGEVTDISGAVVFLASRAAAWVHGASLLVDGGSTAQ